MPKVAGFFGKLAKGQLFGISVGSIFSAAFLIGAVLSLAKKPKRVGDRGRALELSTDPNAPVGVAYGRTATAGTAVFQDLSNQNQDLALVIALSNGGPIDAIEEVRLDDKPVTVDWATGNVTGKYAGYMRFEKRLGLNTETAYAGLVAVSNFWTTAARGDNVASIWWALGWKDGLWNTGIPSALFVLRGVKMYDPRLDSTAGGSGAHRISDPSTWTWPANPSPALCALHYLIGVTENGKRVFGLGVPHTALDLPAFAVAADRCDELVNGKPRFVAGGMVYSTDDPAAVLEAFGAAMGGDVYQAGGLWTCLAAGPQTAAITLTDDDLAGPLEISYAPGWRDVVNTITVNFTDPNRDWRENTTAPITDAAFIAEDDGRELPDEISILMCNDADAAHRLGRLWLSNNREPRNYSARWKPVAWGLRPGMVCTIASASAGLTEKVIVTAVTRNADGTVDLVLRTETDAKYAASDNFAQALPQHQQVTRYDPAAVDTPSLADWTITAVTDADPARTGIQISGSAPNLINRSLIIDFSTDAGGTWTPWNEVTLAGQTDIVMPFSTANQALQIGLKYRNAARIAGPRLVTAISTAPLPAPSFTDQTPGTPGFPDFVGGGRTGAPIGKLKFTTTLATPVNDSRVTGLEIELGSQPGGPLLKGAFPINGQLIEMIGGDKNNVIQPEGRARFMFGDTPGPWLDFAINMLSGTFADGPSTLAQGAGSGLDADLLDGQEGAYYLNWPNFTGLPTTLSGYGITDALPLTGKAADSNLLDGFDSSAFARLGASAPFTAAQEFANRVTKFTNAFAGHYFDNITAPDGLPFKRVIVNDGLSHFSITGGVYFNGAAAAWARDGDGGVAIYENFEGQQGSLSLVVYPSAPPGSAGSAATGGKTFYIAADGNCTWMGSAVLTAANKGVANGVATLDASGQVPVNQLPPRDIADITGLQASLNGKVAAAGGGFSAPPGLPSYNGAINLPVYAAGTNPGRLAWESSKGQLALWTGTQWVAVQQTTLI